jgi:hypothetical protein
MSKRRYGDALSYWLTLHLRDEHYHKLVGAWQRPKPLQGPEGILGWGEDDVPENWQTLPDPWVGVTCWRG